MGSTDSDTNAGLELVMQYLQNSRYGMSISELSRKTNLNRNTISHYMQILSTLGQAEMHTVGSARVYQLSPRLPISKEFLRVQPEPTCVINGEGIIIWANTLMDTRILELNMMPETGLTGKKFADCDIPLFTAAADLPVYKEAMEGKMAKTGKWEYLNEAFGKFRLWILPVVFHNGMPAVMVQIETWGLF